MALSIVAFSEFLQSPKLQFKTLRGVQVVMQNGCPVIGRTSQFAEAQILMNGKKYLLCIPLGGVIEPACERLCFSLAKLGTTALTEYRLLKSEVVLKDSVGCEVEYDVILHAIPAGERLDQAVKFVATSRLRAALELLKRELISLGFVHGNLCPSNLIYGEDGRLYPIRYNYARLGASDREVENDLRGMEEFMSSVAEVAEVGEYTSPIEYDNLLPYDKVYPMQDMMRLVCRDSLYGYLDCNNDEVIALQYTYAEPFFENRAVVQTQEGMMGVINRNNEWVVEPVYDMLGFEDGQFKARIGAEWFELDYLGNKIK